MSCGAVLDGPASISDAVRQHVDERPAATLGEIRAALVSCAMRLPPGDEAREAANRVLAMRWP